jgi:hypothetical protein
MFALPLGTIFGKKFSDITPQDLVSGRAEMNLIIDEKGGDRSLVRTKHVRKYVDIVCLRPRLQIVLYEPIESSNVVKIHPASGARFYRDESDRHRWGITSKDSEQLLERLKCFFRGRADRKIVVTCIKDDS